MTKRRLLIVAFALTAVAVAIPVVPWAIVEWHVREIAADRQAFLEALEAPEGSWEWRAVEELASKAEVGEAIQIELALRALVPTLGWSGEHPESKMAQAIQTRTLGMLRKESATWSVEGFTEDRYLSVMGGMPSPRKPGFGSHSGEDHAESIVLDFNTIYDETQTRRVQRLLHVVRPSRIALRINPELTVYSLRLGDPMVPPEARREAEKWGIDDPDTLVVFAKLREPDGEATADATGSAESGSSP